MADLRWRLLRGGSWFGGPRSCRAAYRLSLHPGSLSVAPGRGDSDIGFRVCGPTQTIQPTQITIMTTIKMLAIPAGSFSMGDNSGYDSERPVHRVDLKAFSMSQTPITQAQWRAVALWEPREGEQWGRELNPNPSRFEGDDLPVEQVSWHDAMEFCSRLSQRTGQKYTLPSEAQWEYACRAGTTTRYPWGDEITPRDANYWGGPNRTTPVGSYPANAWGLQDMCGNVWEWLLDVWRSNYEGAPTDGSAWE